MTNFDIHLVMEQLAARRPIFHTRAEFQSALASQIAETMPGCEVLVNCKPFPVVGRSLNIWLPTEGTAIELKYPARKLITRRGEEEFTLKDRARDVDQRDCVGGIQRLERVVSEVNPAKTGFVVVLTNDPNYWNPPRVETIGDAFRLDEGRVLAGVLDWSSRAGAGSIQGGRPITLTGKYDLRWRDYSALPEKYGQFRYLAVEVG